MLLKPLLAATAALFLTGCAVSAPFAPLGGLPERALLAFSSSLAVLVVVLFAALPWIALLLFLLWVSVRLLRWRIRRKREQKARAEKAAGPNP
ncbi:MAG TPA: hypothetical protein PLZ86_06210 [bacterium]|nr:hypothetical protein [bacterium]